jgi:hypothetical protein
MAPSSEGTGCRAEGPARRLARRCAARPRTPRRPADADQCHVCAETTSKAIIPVLVLDVTEDEADKLIRWQVMAPRGSGACGGPARDGPTDSQAVAGLLERVAGQEAWQAVVASREMLDPPAPIDRAAELMQAVVPATVFTSWLAFALT